MGNSTAKLEWNGTTGFLFFLLSSVVDSRFVFELKIFFCSLFNRGFSTFHAVFVSVASIYLLVISDQFDESVHGDSVINSTTRLSESVMGVSFQHHL